MTSKPCVLLSTNVHNGGQRTNKYKHNYALAPDKPAILHQQSKSSLPPFSLVCFLAIQLGQVSRMPGDKKLESADELWGLYNDLERLKGYLCGRPRSYYLYAVLSHFLPE